ncbi:MAG: prolipoprotein diacylglyceryl transferase, partial [Phycisphaerales bacterium]
MYQELFEIPFIHLTVKSYGLMMVIGFLVAVSLIRRLSRSFTPNPQLITNAALYSLIGGVVGARLFFVVHYLDKFRVRPLEVFAIWQGGLELLGGVTLAVSVILFYMLYHKLPIRRYLDVLAIGLMSALVFGRIGCFLNGCCYGKPAKLPWGVRFPYYSFAYHSQIAEDLGRNRREPQLELPD